MKGVISVKAILLLMVVWIFGGTAFAAMGCPEVLALLLGLAAPVALVIWAVKK